MHDSRDLEKQLAETFGNTEPRTAGFDARMAAGTQLRVWRKRRRRTLAATSLGGVAAIALAWVAVTGRLAPSQSAGNDRMTARGTMDRPSQGGAPSSPSSPQPTAPSTPPRSANDKALLIVETQPSSTVYVDGVVRGESASPLELASGTYEIRVDRDGAPSKTWKVRLRPGQWLRLKHDFALAPVAVEHDSEERNPAPTEAAANVVSKTLADTPTYQVRATFPTYMAKGATETIRVEAISKPGWAIDRKLPIKLGIESAQDVAVFRPVSAAEDAVVFTEQRVAFDVDFNASSSGSKAFDADLKFWVCSKTDCQVKLAKLLWTVTIEESPQLGGLTVVSKPSGAKVTMDGRFVGRTPLDMARLPKGAHHLRIRKNGYLAHLATVRIKANEESRIMVSLEKLSKDEFPWLEEEPERTSDIPERLGRRDITEGIGKIRGRISACGDKHQGDSATLKAKIEIGANGRVLTVSTTGLDARIRACVEKAIKRAKFPKTQKGIVVSYPFVFR